MRNTSALARIALIPESSVATFDAEARRLVSDLHAPRPGVYWVDFLTSAMLGWAGLIVAVRAASFSPLMIAAAAVAVFAFYRALCFMHEITHVRSAALPGFEPMWNALVGLPLLIPSTVYVGVHQDHHKLSTYGTPDDPEYLPFARSRLLTIRFALAAPLIPLFLILRFVVLVPLELAWPRFHSFLAMHASSLSMNPHYRRVVSAETSRTMRTLHIAASGMWVGAALCAWAGLLPWRAFLIWYVVTAFASVINTLRTLVAHDYESTGAVMNRRKQLLDSIDTPGAIWTELWAPVGLRYHALHHYFPGIPYHNLAEGYRRLVKALPDYVMSSGDGLVPELANLYRKGRAAETSGG
jgi:fatty acid desaturase